MAAIAAVHLGHILLNYCKDLSIATRARTEVKQKRIKKQTMRTKWVTKRHERYRRRGAACRSETIVGAVIEQHSVGDSA